MDVFHPDASSSLGPARASRLIAATCACLTLATFAPGIGPLVLGSIALVPQATIGRFYLWNLSTAWLVEVTRPLALATIPAFFMLGRWAESIWGEKELAIFALVVNTLSATGAFFTLLIAYMVTRSQNYIFSPVGGLSALIGGLLVCVKQLIPDHTIGSGPVTLRVKFVPLLVSCGAILAYTANVLDLGGLAFSIGGLYYSWVYLRFFQHHESGRGDPSETFAFQTFFPEQVAPVVAVLSAICFAMAKPILAAVLMSEKQSKLPSPAGNAPPATEHFPPPQRADPADAERRKQRALRALDERLGASQSER